MSNVDIDKIYGEEALKQVDLMNSKLAENVAQVDKITSAMVAMNKSFGANTGGGVKDQIKQVDELAVANSKLEKANSDLGKKLAEVREQTRQVNAENKLLAQYNLAVEGTYEKMDAELKQLNVQYKRYVELNKESSESAKNLQARIIALTDALKKDDQQRGITNRLVGDYKNQLKGLEVQIKQNITAYNNLTTAEQRSATGQKMKADILSLGSTYKNLASGTTTATNNMMTFESVIAKQPAALDKVTKGVSSVWSVIRQAAYILPGVGIAGIMGFVFSGIDTVVSNLDLLGGAVTKAMKGIVDYKDALKNTSSAVGEEIAQLQHLYTVATDTTESYKTRKSAVDELQKLYPNYLKNVSDEAIMSGKVLGIYNDINKALVDKAIFQAYSAQASEVAAKLPELEKRLQDLKAQESKILSSPPTTQTSFSSGVPAYAQTAANNTIIGVQAGIKETEKQINDIKEAITNLFKNASAYSDGIVKTAESAGPKPKETNRIDALKKEYEDEMLAQKKLFVDGTLSEQEYRYKQLEIIHKYATERIDAIKNLTAHEEDSARSLENTWLDTTKTLADANAADQKKRLAELDKQVEGFTEAQDKELKALQDKYKAEAKLREDDAADADYWFKWLEKQSDNQFDEEQRRIQKKQQLNNSYWDKWIQTGRSANDLISTITTAIYDRELARIDKKDKALSVSYTNEIRFIEQSGLSAKEQAKAKAKLEADTEARRKQIDRDRITALRKQATFNKILTISELTLETTIAVIRALNDKSVPNYYLRAINAVAAGAAGAAQIAKAAAVKLPEYAKGRSKGPKEFARTNEQGAELHVTKEGKMYIPNEGKDGITLLEQDTKVIPHDITKQLLNSAYIKLANNGEVVTTNKMTAAMLEAYENQTDEIVRLQNILIKKQFGPNGIDMSGYRNYKSMTIKQ